MLCYINVITEWICGLADKFQDTITNKPLISILFPASGLGASFIPADIIGVAETNGILLFIDKATPYLKFLFLLLTIMLSVVSMLLQLRKLRANNKKDGGS